MPAVRRVNLPVNAPGFWGKNSQASPIDLDTRFAARAKNAVIDQKGRLAAREGYEEVAGNNDAVLGSSDGIEFIYEFEEEDGDKVLVSAGNNKLFTGTTTLTDVTPGAATVTANLWQGAQMGDNFYLFQSGHSPLVLPANGSMGRVVDQGGYVGTVPEGNCVKAAFGRLFVSGVANDPHTVYWSDLRDGLNWGTGSSGSISVEEFWPNGYDEVQAIHVHNSFLVIFGRYNILIYQGAESPSTMALQDTIEGIGCAARDSIQSTGRDVLFLSHAGVRTLGRVIQQKSVPIVDVSSNVEDEMAPFHESNQEEINAQYHPEKGYYLLSFPSSNIAYCFDVRRPLQDGSLRATTWDGLVPRAQYRADDDTYYIGNADGLCKINGYRDNGSSYEFALELHPQSFGAPAVLKILKQVQVAWEGGAGYVPTLYWKFDNKAKRYTDTLTITSASIGEYGTAEYGIAEYSGGALIGEDDVMGRGTGERVTLGITVDIDGTSLSIQNFNVQATTGRTI